MGLTFEALIHENKKRPNNRLQNMLNQKLQNLDSMKNEMERLHRKEKSDLQLRQKIYSRILGSLSRDLSSRAVTKLNSRQDQYPEYKYQLSDEVVLMDEECTWKEAEQDEIGTETEKGSTLTELTVAVELQSSQTKVKMPQAAKIKLPSIDES